MSKLNNLEDSPALGDVLIETLPVEQTPLGPMETLSLTWEQRSRPRRRCKTDSGTELALTLPRGTVLKDGMLILNTQRKTIAVRAEAETVVVVAPANAMELCIVAHHLGNWHRSLQLLDDGNLLIEKDEPLLAWLGHKGIKCSIELRPYHPNLKGAAHD